MTALITWLTVGRWGLAAAKWGAVGLTVLRLVLKAPIR